MICGRTVAFSFSFWSSFACKLATCSSVRPWLLGGGGGTGVWGIKLAAVDVVAKVGDSIAVAGKESARL